MKNLGVLVLLMLTTGCLGTRHFNPMDKRTPVVKDVAPVQTKTAPAPEREPEPFDPERAY